MEVITIHRQTVTVNKVVIIAIAVVSADGFDKNFNTTGMTAGEFYPLNEWVEVAVSVSTQTGEYAVYRNGTEVEVSGPEAAVVTVPSAAYNTIGMAGYNNEYLTGYTMDKYMILDKFISKGEARAVCNGKFTPENMGQNQPPAVDKTELGKVLEKAQDTDLDKYREESVQEFQIVLKRLRKCIWTIL